MRELAGDDLLMLLALLFALAIGTVGYLLCRWLFCLWPPLPLIALWLTLFLLGPNYIHISLVILLLPMLAVAAIGAYFFSASTAGKWKYSELKYLLCFCILPPLEYSCYLIGVYNAHLIPGSPRPYESDGSSGAYNLYVFLLLLSPNIAAFLVWAKLKMKHSLPG